MKPMKPNAKDRERMVNIIKYMQIMFSANQIDSLLECVYEDVNELMFSFTNPKRK